MEGAGEEMSGQEYLRLHEEERKAIKKQVDTLKRFDPAWWAERDATCARLFARYEKYKKGEIK